MVTHMEGWLTAWVALKRCSGTTLTLIMAECEGHPKRILMLPTTRGINNLSIAWNSYLIRVRMIELLLERHFQGIFNNFKNMPIKQRVAYKAASPRNDCWPHFGMNIPFFDDEAGVRHIGPYESGSYE